MSYSTSAIRNLTVNNKSLTPTNRWWVFLNLSIDAIKDANNVVTLTYSVGAKTVGRFFGITIKDSLNHNFTISYADGVKTFRFTDSDGSKERNFYLDVSCAYWTTAFYAIADTGGRVETQYGEEAFDLVGPSVSYYADSKYVVYGYDTYDWKELRAIPDEAHEFDHWEYYTNQNTSTTGSNGTDWVCSNTTAFPKPARFEKTSSYKTTTDYSNSSTLYIARENEDSTNSWNTNDLNGSLHLKAVFREKAKYKVFLENENGVKPIELSRVGCEPTGFGDYYVNTQCTIEINEHEKNEFVFAILKAWPQGGGWYYKQIVKKEDLVDGKIVFTVDSNIGVSVVCLYNVFTLIPVPAIQIGTSYIMNDGGEFEMSPVTFYKSTERQSSAITKIQPKNRDYYFSNEFGSDGFYELNGTGTVGGVDYVYIKSNAYIDYAYPQHWTHRWYSAAEDILKSCGLFLDESGRYYCFFRPLQKKFKITMDIPYYKRFPYIEGVWTNPESSFYNNFSLGVKTSDNWEQYSDIVDKEYDPSSQIPIKLTMYYPYIGLVSAYISRGTGQPFEKIFESDTPQQVFDYTISDPIIVEGESVATITLKLVIWHNGNGEVIYYGLNHYKPGSIVMDENGNIMRMKFQLPT